MKQRGRVGEEEKTERRGSNVFRQQRVVCGWEVLATEAVPHLFNSGQLLPASALCLSVGGGRTAVWRFRQKHRLHWFIGISRKKKEKASALPDSESQMIYLLIFLTFRMWCVQKKWAPLPQKTLTLSLRGWETMRSRFWPSGGRNPKPSGTPERSRTDIWPRPWTERLLCPHLSWQHTKECRPLYRQTDAPISIQQQVLNNYTSIPIHQTEEWRDKSIHHVDQDQRLTYYVLAVISLFNCYFCNESLVCILILVSDFSTVFI